MTELSLRNPMSWTPQAAHSIGRACKPSRPRRFGYHAFPSASSRVVASSRQHLQHARGPSPECMPADRATLRFSGATACTRGEGLSTRFTDSRLSEAGGQPVSRCGVSACGRRFACGVRSQRTQDDNSLRSKKGLTNPLGDEASQFRGKPPTSEDAVPPPYLQELRHVRPAAKRPLAPSVSGGANKLSSDWLRRVSLSLCASGAWPCGESLASPTAVGRDSCWSFAPWATRDAPALGRVRGQRASQLSESAQAQLERELRRSQMDAILRMRTGPFPRFFQRVPLAVVCRLLADIWRETEE